MKNSIYFFILFSGVVLAGCQPTAAKKSEGNYNGNHTVPGFGTQPGSATITATSNYTVKINLMCMTNGMNTSTADAQVEYEDGNFDDVLFYYYNNEYVPDINDWYIKLLSGSTSGDSINLTYSTFYNDSLMIHGCTFSGAK